MDESDFEKRLDNTEHVIEWREISFGPSTNRYIIDTCLADYTVGDDVFDDVDLKRIESVTTRMSNVPTRDYSRGLIERLLRVDAEPKWPVLRFHVEVP